MIVRLLPPASPDRGRRWRVLAVLGILLVTAQFKSAPGAASETAWLHVIVSGLASNAGNVHIALYDDPARFPDSDGMVLKVEVPIKAGIARHRFPALAQKRYAIAVYHDENDNDAFDQGLLGIPLEDFAFSNGATVFFGPPSFEAAAFMLSTPMELEIKINE